jgi:bifunctional UDP-N-acetylglucosamine pyrophosphorylase/glucosamine-1-phosphate N-acetyltransferase
VRPMKSTLPKMLHPIAGRPLLYYSVAAALQVGAEHAVVVVSPAYREAVAGVLGRAFGEERISLVVQDPPRGTGDAARVGLEVVDSGAVLVLYGDTPLLAAADLAALIEAYRGRSPDVALLSCTLDDPFGYGRVLRDPRGRVLEIREERDLESDGQRGIREVNAGVYVAESEMLRRDLQALSPANAQGEYYLTDVVGMGARRGGADAIGGGAENLVGVNDRAQLAVAEEAMYRRIAERHARAGATVRGDARIDDTVALDADTTISAGVFLRGNTTVQRGAILDVGCVVTDSVIGENAVLGAYAVLDRATVPAGSRVDAFARRTPDPARNPR